MSQLDDRLREHYRGLQLDPQLVESLSAQDTRPGVVERARSRWSSWGMGGAIAAMLLVTMTIGIHEFGGRSERTQRTLSEAAMNHSTRLQFEFESDNLAQVDASMTQLQFAVALPSTFESDLGNNLKLLGARYCTINGELAAHVKFLDRSTDKQISLFMTRSVDDLQKISTTTGSVDGVNVSLWNESGLFYAMASR